MTLVKEVITGREASYQFYSVSNTAVHFKVRAANDAQIALTAGPQECDPIYEIVIGSCGNTKSSITKNKAKPNKVEINTPCILNDCEFRGFWVRWGGGVILVGKEGKTCPFMAWTDPEAFSICYFGVRTGPCATGTWQIEGICQEPVRPICPEPVPICPKPEPVCPKPEPVCPTPEPVCPKPEPVCPKPEPTCPGNVCQKPPTCPEPKPCDKNWIDACGGSVPPGAVVGGHDCAGTGIYVIRAEHENMIVPGKLVPSDGCAYITWGGCAYTKQKYQVLVGGPYKWEKKNCMSASSAIVAGKNEKGEPLYVGRVHYEKSVIPGYTTQSFDNCYIARDKRAFTFVDFEVLEK